MATVLVDHHPRPSNFFPAYDLVSVDRGDFKRELGILLPRDVTRELLGREPTLPIDARRAVVFFAKNRLRSPRIQNADASTIHLAPPDLSQPHLGVRTLHRFVPQGAFPSYAQRKTIAWHLLSNLYPTWEEAQRRYHSPSPPPPILVDSELESSDVENTDWDTFRPSQISVSDAGAHTSLDPEPAGLSQAPLFDLTQDDAFPVDLTHDSDTEDEFARMEEDEKEALMQLMIRQGGVLGR